MPSYVETKIVDEDVEPVNFDDDSDIIGISFMTYNAPRAYEIAMCSGQRARLLFSAVIILPSCRQRPFSMPMLFALAKPKTTFPA